MKRFFLRKPSDPRAKFFSKTNETARFFFARFPFSEGYQLTRFTLTHTTSNQLSSVKYDRQPKVSRHLEKAITQKTEIKQVNS